MKKQLSRRRFLQTAAASGSAALLAAAAGAAPLAREHSLDARREEEYNARVRQPLYKAKITPFWDAGSTHFWYRNDLPGGRRAFVRVDAVRGVRAAAFDHARLAAQLSAAAGKTYAADRLPLLALECVRDGAALQFDADGARWECDLASYGCTRVGAAGAKPPETLPPAAPPEPARTHTAFLRDHNLWLRAEADGAETALTLDGDAAHPYGEFAWGPDGKTLAAYRITPAPILPVYLVESAPKDGGTRGVLHPHEYAQPGDPLPLYALRLFSTDTRAAVQAEIPPITAGEPPELRWREDGQTLLLEQRDRGHQFFRVLEVDTRTGRSRVIVDETTKTFINTSHSYTYYTHDAAEVLFMSERDGWRHLYRYDARRGTLINQVTQGEWVVRSVDRVDEAARQIWFQASGRNFGEDPYHLHFYRVNFDGSGLVALTEGSGTHTVQYSPDGAFLIDSYSRADLPPVHTLRKVSDGSLVCPLEEADITALHAGGWRPPEVFRAKGRDGATDIWGLVFRPTHLDPARKYPVIENIYAGPQDSFVRKSFAVRDSMQALAELGFIVVQCDGMGTRNRSKAFHDVCWHNLKDAGLPDRIAWMQALAARYPYCDTRRVGIYGTSAGGQSAAGALLLHPDWYKVGVASCGCHDNRVDKQWWNEQWMGYPVGPWYAESANVTHAAKLRGRLMLIVGELDTNVPPESTLRLADALMKVGKDFDLVVIPGSDHTGGGPYGERRRRDFFLRHLRGIEPPDRNRPSPPMVPVRLTPRPPDEADWAGFDGGADTTVRFHNAATKPVKLFWLPGDGSRKSYGDIAPGETHEQHTFSGHVWLAALRDGPPLALFVAEDSIGLAEIAGEHITAR